MVKFNEDETEITDLNELAAESNVTALVVPASFTKEHVHVVHALIARTIEAMSKPDCKVDQYSINDYGSFVVETIKIKIGKTEISLAVQAAKGEF